LDPPTTVTLMSSYDRMDEVLYYCELVKDYERIVSYHVQNRDCSAALAVMCSKDVGGSQRMKCAVCGSIAEIVRRCFTDFGGSSCRHVLQVHPSVDPDGR
jgi:hypothetical protein